MSVLAPCLVHYGVKSLETEGVKSTCLAGNQKLNVSRYEWYVAGHFSKTRAMAAYQEDCCKQTCMCAWSLISQWGERDMEQPPSLRKHAEAG